MASNSKPLPEVPHSPDTDLTVEGCEHLRKFLDAALSQEPGSLQGWASTMQRALVEVTESMRDEEWLAGIKLAKSRRKRRKEKVEGPGTLRRWDTASSLAIGGGGKVGGTAAEIDIRRASSPVASEHAGIAFPPRATSPEGSTKRDRLALQQLRDVASLSKSRGSRIAKHVLFTLASSEELSPKSSDHAPTCTFSAGKFMLPKSDLFGDDPAGNEVMAKRNCLYGFEEWETDPLQRPEPILLVGGSFQFTPHVPTAEYDSLVKVLRSSLYVLLSILLEQSLLSDASIELSFPKPETHERTRPINRMLSISRPSLGIRTTAPDNRTHNLRDSFLSRSIWGLLGKRTNNMFPRHGSSFNSDAPRGGSLDLATPVPSAPPPPTPADEVPTSIRTRRFSFFGEPKRAASIPTAPEQEQPVFQTVHQRLREAQAILSTSPDVVIPPPLTLARLAEKEREAPGRRLSGEERSALASIYGWEGRRTKGSGMVGVTGFLRQQRLSVLYSEHIPPPTERSASISSEMSVLGSSSLRLHCGPRARLRTYKYYSNDISGAMDADILLGDAIIETCSTFNESCGRSNCGAPRGMHERRWLHNGTRVMSTVQVLENADSETEYVEMWDACSECGQTTQKRRMSDGTSMLSFGKFLELLFYSPRLAAPSKPPCEHTTAPPRPWTGEDMPLPRSRFCLVRRFSYRQHVVSFSISHVHDLFELRLPHLHITRGSDRTAMSATPSTSAISNASGKDMDSEEKRVQWKEIKGWWQSIADHLDMLEKHFLDDEDERTAYHKTLPRLPSSWDESPERHEGIPAPSTPKQSTSSLPASSATLESGSTSPRPPALSPTPSAPSIERHISDASYASTSSSLTTRPLPRAQSTPLTTERTATSPQRTSDTAPPDALALLSKMRYAFQRTEQALYGGLRDAQDRTLNDIRRIFHTSGLGALRRLAAWEAKHLPKSSRAELIEAHKRIERPWWWGESYHAVPGSNVIIKEDDWGSIIAFTLSSRDYQQELLDMVHRRTGTDATVTPEHNGAHFTLPSVPGMISPAASTASESGFKFFRSTPKLDPDDDGTVWAEAETYSAVISRKEHPRDPTALLSLREVLRSRAPTNGERSDSLLGGFSSRFTSRDSQHAKPAVDVSKAEASGSVSAAPANADTIEKLLHELDSASSSDVGSQSGPSEGGNSAIVTAHIQRRKTSTVISQSDHEEDDGSSDSDSARTAGPGNVPASAPHDSSTSEVDAASVNDEPPPPVSKDGTSSAFTWNTITNAVRYMVRSDAAVHPGSPNPGARSPHGLLAPDDVLAIDQRPHIKYDWTIGRRLKFSCTVYYAKQFDALRRQCGIEDSEVFIRSMSRSANWSADGGKSKSNFWKTADDRFIIKTLVNAWNVADLQVLIDLAPSYFKHMGQTATRASLLAKLLGFYTVEIRNLETGNVQARTDLLVMENLFFKQKIAKTFDLKGIQGRKVKTDVNTSKTLFDGEWIEGQEKALTLVYPHSKAILHEGLRSDCDFLAKSNIMDYSLLLGIDQESKEISCGLVDTIGSYTFAKTLEYKAKQGLARDSKEVTVIPPDEYRERFINTLDGYFLACPDKWTKPADDQTNIYDYRQLPSVL
ncbi:hypothetical protein PENSPDRAFT_751730 [Peniophora sp. CONT]|nr:hypothetical protein PENSPDRAFT_751730 [Peniophora sp. CONT]